MDTKRNTNELHYCTASLPTSHPFAGRDTLSPMHHPIVNPNVPKTKGPYSQVTRLDQLLFVSGQASTDPVTGDLIPGSFDVQARQAFENLSAALRPAGSGLEHVVKPTVFLCDPANFPAIQILSL